MPSRRLSVVMGSIVYSLRYLPFTDQSSLFAAQVAAGVVIYTGTCYLFRITSYMEVVAMLKEKLYRQRGN